MHDDTSALVTRRAVIAGSAAIGVSATPLAYAATRAAARRDPARPNIVFIMADDPGYADVSCYGRRDCRTPHIDSLATHGMRFVNAYANSSVCTPTRVALATGRYQYRLPIGLEEPLSKRDVGLPPSHPTIASLLGRLHDDAGWQMASRGLSQIWSAGKRVRSFRHL